MKNLKLWRISARFILALTLVLSVSIIIISMFFLGDKLTMLPAAAWGMVGVAVTKVGDALASLARAMAKNPSDVDNGKDEDDE